MRRAVVLVVLAACKPSPSTQTEPAPSLTVATSAAVSAPSSTASALPADFPARGAPKLTGTLAGKPFVVAKAMMRKAPEGATLDLYSWSEPGACAPQFAPKPEQLYVEVTIPAARTVSGTVLHAHEDGVFVVYKRDAIGNSANETATVVLDEIDATHVAGRLLLSASDGTRVAGSFDATMCSSPQQQAAGATSVLGLAWGTEVDPAKLPTTPVTTMLVGKTASPAAVESIDWDDGSLSQHELHFFMMRPAQSCGFDQMSPGFKIGFPSAFRKGLEIRSSVTTVTTRGSAFGVVLWNEPGGVVGIEGRGFVSAVIDDATSNELRGRVLAYFEDASKSMIAGAFTAKRCHVKP